MRRAGHLALVALVVASALTVAATPASADDAFVSVEVETTPDPAQPGTNVTVTTTVENLYDDGSSYRLQRLELREGESTNSTRRDVDRPSTVVNAGETLTVNLSEEFDRTGEFDRYVHVRLRSGAGQVVTLVRPVTVSVEQPHPAMSLSADGASAAGETDLTLTVANGLPDVVRGLSVELESDAVSVLEDRHVVSSLDPGDQAEVTVPVRDVEAGTQTVDARLRYLTADGESRSVTRTLSTTVEDVDRPAEIELTGLRVTEDGDEVVVRGSASNTGSSNATSVKIAAAEGDAVAPAQNQASYFVGEVAASDYSSFEVHATHTADGNETVSIPLDVSYTVDGDRVTRTVPVEYTPTAADDAQARQSSSGLLVPGLVGLVVVVVGGLGWRRYR